MRKHSYVYALICISVSEFDRQENEFILGMYKDEKKANDNLREVEAQAREDNQDLEYRIDKYEVIE